MKKLLKDPLIHFLLIGLLLFILYSLVNDASESRDNIVIDTNDINSAIEKWRLQWKRPPTKEELAGLLTQNMQQEVFYQEALKMNLDHT